MTRVQHQSEGFKYGNPPDHDNAVHNVMNFMQENGLGKWLYWTEQYERFPNGFTEDNNLRFNYGHSYDLTVTTTFNMVQPFLYIEVDGPKHSKKQQKINDGIAEKYVREVLKQDIIRLDKTECNGLPEDRDKYLRSKLGNYIK